MQYLLSVSRFAILFVALIIGATLNCFATGEINLVRVPEEIAEGDDLTVLVSASAREVNIDRDLAIEYPESWKIKRAYRVEAGSDVAVVLGSDPEVNPLLVTEPGHAVLALADNSEEFDRDAEGIAYFIVFSTKQIRATVSMQTFSVKAALVERTSLDAISELDPKTKKPKPQNKNWRMTFPPKYDMSFAGVTSKRLSANVKVERIVKTSRSLIVEGRKYAIATMRTTPEVVKNFFAHPFSIQFWFRTTGIAQNIIGIHSESGVELRIGTGALGQPLLAQVRPQKRVIIGSRTIVNDGQWHNLVLSRDSLSKLRLFVDAQPAIATDAPRSTFEDITSLTIGDSTADNDFAIDELNLLHTDFREPAEFERGITTAGRDTAHRAFAIFHFDDFGPTARSSVPLYAKSAAGENAGLIPISIMLDSAATIAESTSPIQLDQVMLSADLLSPTRVNIGWKTTSELGVKQYRIERRVGSFGLYEKVLAVDAKHGIKSPKRGQSVISRNSYAVAEDLPKLTGDIELFYRLAIVGFNEKEPPSYSVPVKLEYGADRDVFVEQNQPNPFNPTTQIAFRLTKPETIRLSVFDIFGREVAQLANGKLEAGRHVYPLDGTNWPGGIYFYKVKTTRTTITRKMILAK
jgi:hypothetical protein